MLISGEEKITGKVLFSIDMLFSGKGVPVTVVILAAFVIVLAVTLSLVSLFLSRKLKESNRILENKTRTVEDLNNKLFQLNRKLNEYAENLLHQLSDSDNFFRTLLDSAEDGIAFYDKAFNLKFSNDTFYSLLGLTREEYNKINPEGLIHPEDTGYLQKRNDAVKSNKSYESELRLKHKNGHYITLSTKTVPVPDTKGEATGYLIISRDITAQKKYHEELLKAKNEVEESNKLKASFLANISHEIRTPLNSVVGFANLLYDNSLSPETRVEYIDHINYNSEKLLQIIGDIIDLSRLESSELEVTYEENSVSEILRDAAESIDAIIKRNEKPVVLVVRNELDSSQDMIFTDRVWLKRVLHHLLENAVKFTLEGSVEVNCRKQDNNLCFSVKDTGIGISRENLDVIFEGFRQEVNGHQRPFEGLGIGLTLVREVLKRMGGDIKVASEKGLGSEFSFTIPYRPAGSSAYQINVNREFRENYNWTSRKCLVVDDNREILIYIKRILSDTGIEVFTAKSAAEALSMLNKQTDLDIVLLDMQMPEMNGIEAAREIRKIRKDIPVIAQTAFIFENDKDIILEAGCDACLIKPVRKENLLSTMSLFIK